jgi:hypothetical protein
MIKLDLNPSTSQLRQFGWISLAGFPLVGVMLTKAVGLPMVAFWICLGVGLAMGLLALLGAVAAIKPVYIGMMLIALPIGAAISFVLLSLIYFGMFTPVAVAFRLAGRDPLERKIDRSAPSYWHVRTKQRAPASYLRLY